MEISLETIQTQVTKIKNNILVQVIENPSSFISASAYDTAWLAMISDPKENNEKPMFKSCLEWVLSNQRPEGFWGERDCHGNPTIDSLPATLACIVALKMWDYGHQHIEKGLAFLRKSLTEIKIEDINGDYPRWFAIVFPGMVELASRAGLQIMFADDMKGIVAHSFSQNRKILETEELVDRYHYPSLLSYLEVLPSSYQIEEATITKYLSGDGSLYQSPAATAAAYIATKNPETLSYLRNLVRNCSQGVPSMYPIDEDIIKLKMVNHLQKLGLSDHFNGEIKAISEEIYSHYNEQEAVQQDLIPANIFKSSLAFEVLRLQGYKVSPGKFCGFLNDESALQHIKDNSEMFGSILYSLYRTTNLMFESEEELRELRSFSRSLLAECCLSSKPNNDGIMMWPHLQEGIESELLVPWMARMEHLDHRKWIEGNEESPLWLGKASFYRISCLDNMDLLQLAKQNYEYRQMVYKKELVELIRWSKVWGLTDMGFAREKTTYCYFAIASSSDFHYDSDIRLVVAKSAVLITVFDDFFDMEGSLDDLQTLADAVQRWDNKDLKSHSKILFDVLDNFVDEVAKKYHDQHKFDITNNLRKMWFEVIASWLTEATWSKTGEIPSMASYLDTGMISIAAHVLVLQASCFTPSSSNTCHHSLNPSQYEAITKLLMTSCRLLNDIQSYEKEVKDGKLNSVLLHLKENPKANIEDAVNYVENILEETKMKLLEHALTMDGIDDSFPRPCKMLHLSALKVFQMFFNSANHFDSKEILLNDINKAIFVPFEDHTSFNLPKPLTFPSRSKKMHLVVNSVYSINLKNYSKSTKLTMHHIPFSIALKSHQLRMKIPPCTLGFAC